MKGLITTVMCLLALSGCSATASGTPSSVSPSATTSPLAAPANGVLLASLGFAHAPAGFSVPGNVHITERADLPNQITAVFTAPDGYKIASYLREHLPTMGFEITGDKNNALLFNNGTLQGAFYAEGGVSALSLRSDQETR